jgi:hypothetical protein
VGDEHQRSLVLRLKLGQHPQDLRRHRWIECRGGLVREEDRGPGSHGDGRYNSLPHATAELMRIIRQTLPRRRDPDVTEKFDGTRAPLFSAEIGVVR